MIEEQETIATPERQSELPWLLSCAVVTAVAAFVRFFWLDLKPLHHDEGVNGFFLTTLFRSGEYKYDPANYHGPDLYYIALAFTKIFGLNTLSIRWSVAVFGVLVVVLTFYLRRYIGRTGAIFAAFFLALSPGMTFISRYFIHEMLFVFLSLGFIVAVMLFVERTSAGKGAIAWMSLVLLVCFLPSALNLSEAIGGNSTALLWTLRGVFFVVEAALVVFVMRMLVGWNEGRPIYLLLAATCAVMLAATKETAFITIGTMAIAGVCVYIWLLLTKSEIFVTKRTAFAIAFTALAAVVALVEYNRIYEGFKSVYDNFKLADNETQIQLFWAIVALSVLGAVVWIAFVAFSGGDVGSDIEVDDQFNWNRFLEATSARDTNEFMFAKTLVGGAVVLSVWAFVRFAVSGLVAMKAEKGAGASLSKIEFSGVDGWIVAIGIAMLAIAAAIWFSRRERQVPTDLLLMFVVASAIFLYVGALFFSSFFTFPEGLSRAFEAYAIWTKTGKADHTQNGRLAYFRWGMIIESPLLVVSALGTLIALFKARHRFAMFAGLWALGLLMAYTLIPYKTPWLALSFLLPMAIIGGYGINELLGSRAVVLKALGGVLAVMSSVILAYQTYDINFVRYDNDAMPYIYAHTRREFTQMIDKINHYAEKSGKGKATKIEIASPDYWPMPWYTNNFDEAIYSGKTGDPNGADLIVAKKGDQDDEIIERYAMRYRYVGEYPLRPGVELVLLVKRDIADADTKDIYDVFGETVR